MEHAITSFFKVFIEFVTTLLLFFGHEACGVLDPWPGVKLVPPALEDKVLTTELPGQSRLQVLIYTPPLPPEITMSSFENRNSVLFIFVSLLSINIRVINK